MSSTITGNNTDTLNPNESVTVTPASIIVTPPSKSMLGALDFKRRMHGVLPTHGDGDGLEPLALDTTSKYV